jgi:hypothetical protein
MPLNSITYLSCIRAAIIKANNKGNNLAKKLPSFGRSKIEVT